MKINFIGYNIAEVIVSAAITAGTVTNEGGKMYMTLTVTTI